MDLIQILRKSVFLLALQSLFALPVFSEEVSIFHLPLKWKDESGKEVTLSQWQDSPVIMAMAYTAVAEPAPAPWKTHGNSEGANRKIQKSRDFHCLPGSEYDTPARLLKFRKNRKMDFKADIS